MEPSIEPLYRAGMEAVYSHEIRQLYRRPYIHYSIYIYDTKLPFQASGMEAFI
jgi:hypothetical protein